MATRVMLLLLAVISLTAPAVHARQLRAERNWGDDGDPSGTQVLSRARSFEGRKGTVRRAVTPEMAEASANSQYAALFRNQIDPKKSSVTFAMTPATVEATRAFTPEANQKEVVKSRARSAIDQPGKPLDLQSGSAQMPTMAMGSVSASQTFEGATSIAASDAVFVNGDSRPNGFKKTTAAKSMISSYATEVPRASKSGSFGTTAQTAGSASYAGPGDGKITIAQAHEVSAIAQASQSGYDQWQIAPNGDDAKWDIAKSHTNGGSSNDGSAAKDNKSSRRR